jgi:hypothetical protein
MFFLIDFLLDFQLTNFNFYAMIIKNILNFYSLTNSKIGASLRKWQQPQALSDDQAIGAGLHCTRHEADRLVSFEDLKI